MDNQITEAWYSPKSKKPVLFLCKQPPQNVLHYGVVKTVNGSLKRVTGSKCATLYVARGKERVSGLVHTTHEKCENTA